MSHTYSIACKDCKKHLWIAQGWGRNDGHLYTKYRKEIYKFLFDHKGHNLLFDNNCESEISEIDDFGNDIYEEIEIESIK
jgi:hypothetical protein